MDWEKKYCTGIYSFRKLPGTQLASYSINRLLLNDVLTETHSSETWHFLLMKPDNKAIFRLSHKIFFSREGDIVFQMKFYVVIRLCVVSLSRVRRNNCTSIRQWECENNCGAILKPRSHVMASLIGWLKIDIFD